MVIKKISRREAAANFDALVLTLQRTAEPVQVEDNGKVVAVVVSPTQFDELAWKQFFTTVEQIQQRNANKNPARIHADVDRAVEEVRAEMYDRS